MKLNKIVVGTVGLLILLVGVVLWRENAKQEAISTSSPIPSPKVIEESVENGVYTNYTYGFRFQYPSDIFDTEHITIPGPEKPEQVSAPWYFQKIITSSDNPAFIEVYVYKYIEEDKSRPGALSFFFDVSTKNDGASIMQYDYKNERLVPVGTKISDINTNGVSGVFYQYTERFEDHRLGAELYSADWLKDDKIYIVRMITNDKQSLGALRSELEEMIKSFQFIAPVK